MHMRRRTSLPFKEGRRGEGEMERERERERACVSDESSDFFCLEFSEFLFELLSSTWAVRRSRCWTLGTKTWSVHRSRYWALGIKK